MLLWKCFLWSIRLQSPVRWGVRRNGVERGTGAIAATFEDQRIQPVKCYDIFFNEETSSHFSPEGFETKAKVQLTFFKTFF